MSGYAPAGAAPARFDPVARGLHWAVAALALIVVVIGWAMPDAPRNTLSRELLFLLHRSIGMCLLALMLFRLGWRWRHPPPPLPAHMSWIERTAAHLDHLLLYVMFLLMPLAGYVNAAAAGHAVSIFGLFSIPPLLPEDGRLSQIAIAIHLLGQYLVYLLVLAHVAAALFHGIVRRDGVLERMLPRRRLAA